MWVAAWFIIGLVAAIACAILLAFLRRLKRQAGYALMAWIVQHQGWYEWTGATPADV